MSTQPNRNLKTAIQGEILRSHQRDNDFITNINESIIELLHRYKLYRHFTALVKSDVLAKIFYFIVTSGFGNQTLGEEYTGIVQANLRTQKVPTLMVRILAAVLECFGEQMLIKIIHQLQIKINKPDSGLTYQAKTFINIFINRLCKLIPILILVHRGLFYICGRYYSLGRRLTAVDYVKVYGPRPHMSVNWGLRILGVATITQCFFQFWQSKKESDILSDETDLENISNYRCQLCLEKESNSATPCGHLFCWSCLAEWLKARHRCPFCRESIAPTRIIPLMNL